MLLIYFCGKYNRYKKHNNIISQCKFAATKYYHPYLCIFASNEQEPAYCACKNPRQRRWLTVSQCYDGIIARKMLPMQTKFHCAHIHRFVSINVQQASVNVSGCHFSYMEEFSDTLLLHMYFHVTCHLVGLPLCCHLSHGNMMQRNIGGKVQPLLPYLQHLPLTLWASIIK